MTRLCEYFDIKRDANGDEYMEVYIEGIALLRLIATNKGTAFPQHEREALGLDGLLPPQVNTQAQQVARVYRGFLRQPTSIAKYQYLRALQERSEILFYALLCEHLEEMLPIVYTPTVGQAVQEYSYLYQTSRGLSLSPINIGHAHRAVGNYPWNDVRMIVATDSSAILGLGDQGYGGLAIAIGKLSLYTVAGGISPFHTMPVKLDVGTDRQDLIDDPGYLGVPRRRLRGEEYLAFMDRFVDAIEARWPAAVIQWEDFAKDVAFTVLDRYRDRIASFNDDIQGTGAMALAGLLAACRMKHESLADQRVIVFGAGAAGIGVSWAIVEGMVRGGLSRDQALARVYVIDSRGLLVEGRAMDPYKRAYAQRPDNVSGWSCRGDIPDLMETIANARATCLLGFSGQAGAFNRPVVEAMRRNAARPVIFPLSNPTAVTEGLPSDILAWTDGQAIVATGSPFDDVEYRGKTYPIGQGNNAFIFPGLGYATILCEARKVTDDMVLEAAFALADYTARRHPEPGRVYPPVAELQEVSIHVARRVIEHALEHGVARRADLAGRDIEAFLREKFWRPRHLPFVKGTPD